MQSTPSQHSHHFRFYLVMTTLVIGGILFLLLINNNQSLSGITSSVVKDTTIKDSNAFTDSLDEDGTIEAAVNPKEVAIDLSFDQIPTIRKEAKIESMEVQFTDAGTKIFINGDKLELNNLEQVTLKIQKFAGKMDLTEQGLSLNGKAKRLEVNGVTLSSRSDIAISFSNLKHQAFIIDALELKDGLELPRGTGTLQVAGKLTYALEQDQLKMDYFNGQLATSEEGVQITGVASGIEISGALLNLNLR